ncbi:hypothetical protein O988_09594 [Pseudogymnoascus sp. VKM F-3808]|nr:hypothetical protein O988_09594 [Pseudogymnoascus sp. VKM F-3808]
MPMIVGSENAVQNFRKCRKAGDAGRRIDCRRRFTGFFGFLVYNRNHLDPDAECRFHGGPRVGGELGLQSKASEAGDCGLGGA